MAEFSDGPVTFDAMVSRQLENFEIEQLKRQLDEYQIALKSIQQIVNSSATGWIAVLIEKKKIAELINALNL
jgi:hypothetical protein